VRLHEAIFATTAWDKAVIVSTISAVPVTKVAQLFLARRPVNSSLLLLCATSITNALAVKMNCLLWASSIIFELNGTGRALIANNA
jgi:hypothetical protein